MNTKNIIRSGIMALMLCGGGVAAVAQSQDAGTDVKGTVVDEVIWVVGDEAILKSDVEAMRIQAAQEGQRWNGDPDCVIPEQLAVQKLFLNQADIDSIEVTDNDVLDNVNQQINYWIQMVGSREKLEEYKKQSITEMREELIDALRDRERVSQMRKKLVADVSVTPAEVRRYFSNMPEDSIPFVPTQVEVQILTQMPVIEQEEINRVKNELRTFTDRVTKGETTFATLARLYSEDLGTARQGGELDYTGRASLDPAFADVAFNLTDPKKISKVFESEYGFHIIQFIDRRGDKIKVRHILKKPIVSDDAINKATARLDSVRTDLEKGTFTFDEAAVVLSDDKDTRNNKGLMFTSNPYDPTERTSKFKLQDLPAEVAKVVDTLAIGAVSAPFTMINARGKTVCAIVKLKSRIDGHRAVITEDYQMLKDVVLNKRREEKIHQWVVDKIKSTYIRVGEKYRNCDFEYEGWIK